LRIQTVGFAPFATPLLPVAHGERVDQRDAPLALIRLADQLGFIAPRGFDNEMDGGGAAGLLQRFQRGNKGAAALFAIGLLALIVVLRLPNASGGKLGFGHIDPDD